MPNGSVACFRKCLKFAWFAILQMNLADSERMAGVLEAVGYECAEDPSKADVLIYNTCSIREKAEVKVYSALGKQVMAPGSGSLPQWYVPCKHQMSRAGSAEVALLLEALSLAVAH
jgi:hypothetical protein